VGRMSTTTDPAGRVFSHEYDPSGLPTKLQRPNGVDTTWTHDGLSRLTNVRTFRRATNTTVASYAYGLGVSGLRNTITESDGTVRAYAYDDVGRLVGEGVSGGTGPQYTKTFAYDAVSNRSTQVTAGAGAASVSYDYDSRQRLQSENAQPYIWDANGNQTQRPTGDAYVWDFEDRLVRVTKADGTVVQNTYDVDGVLVRTVTTPPGGAAVATDYVVDTQGGLSHIVAEVNGAGSVSAVYVRAGDMLLEEIRGGVPKYFEAEGIGSVRSLLDASGAVTDAWRYTAFGEELTHTGTGANPYRFAGERYVGEVGLYQNRARWLDTGRGAFVSMDPLRGRIFKPLTAAPFVYGGQQPSGLTDPSGREFTLTGLTITVGIGAAFNVALVRPTTFGDTIRVAAFGGFVGAASYTGVSALTQLYSLVAAAATGVGAATLEELPMLEEGPGGKMLGQAIAYLLKSPSGPRAAMFAKFAEQIEAANPGSWRAIPIPVSNAAAAFSGGLGRVIVFDNSGRMFVGEITNRAAFLFGPNGTFTVVFSELKEML
jgi:RHS repeat-associated protein